MKDDTYEIQGPEHLELINNTIPHYIKNDKLHYDRCHIYNGTSNGNESLVSCNSWVFDKSVFTTSVVQQVREFFLYFIYACRNVEIFTIFFDSACKRKITNSSTNMMFNEGSIVSH